MQLKNLLPASQPGQKVYQDMPALAFRTAFYTGLIAIGILILYSWGESNSGKTFLELLGIVVVLSFASFATGGIIGFLFGIPHTVQQNTVVSTPVNTGGTQTGAQNATTVAQSTTATPPIASSGSIAQGKSNFASSTNLEQIADWLTKIIVGVGLTQIHKIINLFNQLCISLGSTIHSFNEGSKQNGSLIVGAIIIFFSIEGFLIVYLWTFIYLKRIEDSLSSSDVLQLIAAADKNDKDAIDLEAKQLSLPDGTPDIPVSDLVAAFRKASSDELSRLFFKAVSQRKQYWRDPATKYKIEKTIPIFKALIAIDENFEMPENFAELGFALKDLQTPDYKEALLNFDKAVGAFTADDRIANKGMIYFNRAYCRIKVDPNFTAVPPQASTPANKQLILADLNEAAKEPSTAAIIANDPLDSTVQSWKALNP